MAKINSEFSVNTSLQDISLFVPKPKRNRKYGFLELKLTFTDCENLIRELVEHLSNVANNKKLPEPLVPLPPGTYDGEEMKCGYCVTIHQGTGYRVIYNPVCPEHGEVKCKGV